MKSVFEEMIIESWEVEEKVQFVTKWKNNIQIFVSDSTSHNVHKRPNNISWPDNFSKNIISQTVTFFHSLGRPETRKYTQLQSIFNLKYWLVNKTTALVEFIISTCRLRTLMLITLTTSFHTLRLVGAVFCVLRHRQMLQIELQLSTLPLPTNLRSKC